MRVACEWSSKCRIIWSVYLECLFFSVVLKYVVPALCLALTSRSLVLNPGLANRLYFTYAEEMERFERDRQVCVCSGTEGRHLLSRHVTRHTGSDCTALHCTINIIRSELVATHSISCSQTNWLAVITAISWLSFSLQCSKTFKCSLMFMVTALFGVLILFSPFSVLL